MSDEPHRPTLEYASDPPPRGPGWATIVADAVFFVVWVLMIVGLVIGAMRPGR